MGKKKYVTIPKVVSIKCKFCDKISKRKPPVDGSPHYFDCDKCGQRVATPITSCCIICAFSKKKCPASLIMEAHAKGLEIR